MALKKCKECGKEISTKAKTCPDCRVPVKVAPKKIGIGTGCGCLIIGGFILFIIFLATQLPSNRIIEQTREQAGEQAKEKTRKLEEKKKDLLNGVEYQIINDESYFDYKRSVDVRLAKKVSQEVLKELAHKIKNSTSKKYERTFICYYLPEMKINAGAWATTHFTPNLEVKILGLSQEDEERMEKKRQSKSDDEIVGCWLDTAISGLESEVTIFKKGDTYYVRNVYKDGSESMHECLKRKTGNKLYLINPA